MFIVDTVSFLSLWYLFGEHVYILLRAGIHRAETPLAKGDLFFTPFYFERLSGYKKSLKLEHVIWRLITVITELCYSRKSCSLPMRSNLKGPSARGIIKACSFYKNGQYQEETVVLENTPWWWELHSFPSEAMLILCTITLKTNLGYNHFCLILFCDANTHLGYWDGFDPFSSATYFKVRSDLKCSLQ